MIGPVITLAIIGAITGGMFAAPALAQAPAVPAHSGRTGACAILTRQEVKKIVPWNPVADGQKETEQPSGTGSVCAYPGVRIWVGEFSPSILTGAGKIGPLTPVPGLGDEAFLHANGSSFIELYVMLGDRLVHIQKGIPFGETFDSLKAPVLTLGKALVAKLK